MKSKTKTFSLNVEIGLFDEHGWDTAIPTLRLNFPGMAAPEAYSGGGQVKGDEDEAMTNQEQRIEERCFAKLKALSLRQKRCPAKQVINGS